MPPRRCTMEVELITSTPCPLCLIEKCGRLAWNTETAQSEEDRDKFIEHLIRVGHESVLEHASATFIVTGLSRACSHQLVRHRIASYTQRSQRHVDEKELKYVVPPSIALDKSALEAFEGAMRMASQSYAQLRALGIPKEDARFVLPNACATQIAITMNFRELRHFISLRCAPDAQWEIKEMAFRMLSILEKIAHPVFSDLWTKYGYEKPR